MVGPRRPITLDGIPGEGFLRLRTSFNATWSVVGEATFPQECDAELDALRYTGATYHGPIEIQETPRRTTSMRVGTVTVSVDAVRAAAPGERVVTFAGRVTPADLLLDG